MADGTGWTEEPFLICLGVVISLAVSVYYIMFRNQQKIPSSVDLNNQSVVLKGGIHTSLLSIDGQLMNYLYEDAQTLYECFQRGLRVSNNGICLGSRTGPNKEYEWMHYQQVFDAAKSFGSGLIELGLKPATEAMLGIYCKNRTEWVISEQACNTYNLVVVPLYDTLGTDACKFIINQASLSMIVVDKADRANKLLDSGGDLPTLKALILVNCSADEGKAQAHNISLYKFKDVQDMGKKNLREPVPPHHSDLATLCYTSGTTGNPKGVMLTHRNIVSNVSAIVSVALIGDSIPIDSNLRHISYLPLAHMFERGAQVLLFMHGAHLGFFQGDVKLLLDDMQALRPTLFCVVPRLLNRLYDRVTAGVQGSRLKSFLLQMGLKRKYADLKRGIVSKDTIWDKLIFRKIQNLVGGNLKGMITGSAPLSGDVLNFARCAFGCTVVEGYGQTEISAGITFGMPGDIEPGHVGPPLPCCRAKLEDVAEMGYYAAEGKGEVLAMGPSVFRGYYKDKEKTDEVLDKDGWLHTGDIGEWLPNGTLKIIDRKKNIFKLAQGEYIAPEKIEIVYMRNPIVAQMFVNGDSLKTCPMGVVVPDPETLPDWAARHGILGDMAALCKNEKVKDLVLHEIINEGKNSGLHTFEQVKDIILQEEQFTIENGMLTPTYKNKRPFLALKFKEPFERLYKKHHL